MCELEGSIAHTMPSSLTDARYLYPVGTRDWPPRWHPTPSEPRKPPTSRGLRGSGGRVSNPRPRAWEARALPTELPPHDAGKPLLNRCSCSLSLLPGRASHALVSVRDCARNAVSTRNLHADEGAKLILGLLVAAHAVTIHTERESRVSVPEQIHHCSGVRAQSRKQARVGVSELLCGVSPSGSGTSPLSAWRPGDADDPGQLAGVVPQQGSR